MVKTTERVLVRPVIRKTLAGGSSESAKKKKQVVRSALRNPHNFVWPTLGEEAEGEILGELIPTLEKNVKPKPSVDPKFRKEITTLRTCFFKKIREILMTRPKLPGKERRSRIAQEKKHLDAAKKVLEDEFKAEGVQDDAVKKGYVLGVNEVMKRAERDQLSCVIVDSERSVGLLTNAVLPMCFAKKIPACAISNMMNSIAPILKVKSLTCLGILKGFEGYKSVVDVVGKHGELKL